MDKAVAERAREKILEVEPRHYLTGNTYGLNNQLKEMGCRFDGVKKQWYAPNDEIAKQAQAAIEKGPEKFYIPRVPFKLNRKMQDMGCRWDPETKQWFHADSAKAREAMILVANETPSGGATGTGFSASHAINQAVQSMAHEM